MDFFQTQSLFFDQALDRIVIAQAPGRLDVMGGIADYSGSLVLQMPLRERATVRAAFRPDNGLHFCSAEVATGFSADWDDLPFGDYDALRAAVLARPGGDWAIYPLGCLAVLLRECDLPRRGLEVWVESEVPLGKGVSSSAALGVAAMRAFCQLYGVALSGTTLPRLAQRAENLVADSPCGLMDQLASCFGKPGHLLPIHCQPDALLPALHLPEDLHFVGLDSGIRHAVSGASYGQVRAGAFMGYSMIAQRAGASPAVMQQARDSGDWSGLPYGGFLSNVSPAFFDKNYQSMLPETLSGRDFLQTHGPTIDAVSHVFDDTTYAIRACTRHPVHENFRVNAFAAGVQSLDPIRLRTSASYRRTTLGYLGELMRQSHESYSACGLGDGHTDTLAARIRAAGPEAGVFGAKITGGGSGGTVCVLAYGAEGLATARRILAEYERAEGLSDLRFFGE